MIETIIGSFLADLIVMAAVPKYPSMAPTDTITNKAQVVKEAAATSFSKIYGDSIEKKTEKKAWKTEGKHTVGIRKSLYGSGNVFGYPNSLVGWDSRQPREKLQVSDIHFHYNYKLGKRWRIGAEYTYSSYNYKPFDPADKGFTLAYSGAYVQDYYYHNFRLTVAYDFVKKKHFILRGNINIPLYGTASGAKYQYTETSKKGTYEVGNYRTFGDDYGGSSGAANASGEWILDFIFPISKHFEVGPSLYTRIQNPEIVGGISVILNYKF